MGVKDPIGGNRGPNYNVTWDGNLLTVQSWDPKDSI